MNTSLIRTLVFVGTEGIYHDHPGTGRFLTQIIEEETSVSAEFSQDYDILSRNLQKFDTVLFYTDIGSLTEPQENGLLNFIQGGGGFLGLHTASASFLKNPRYHKMLNGYFDGHSDYMDFEVSIVDRNHPITESMEKFSIKDELHYFSHDKTLSHRLMEAYDPGKKKKYAMALHHMYGKGRVFYFALGHDNACHSNPNFKTVLKRGILWTANNI